MAGEILIVDDDGPIRSLLTIITQRAGFAVDVAHDGAEALEKIASSDYLVVLLDLMMPRMSGYEVIDRLRELPRRPAVIAITATSDIVTRDIDTDVVQSVVRKPFDIDVIANLIIDCSRALRQARTTTPPRRLPPRNNEASIH